jgi:hypothetical protein
MPITLERAADTANAEKQVTLLHAVNVPCPYSGESVVKSFAQLGIAVRSFDV